MLSVVIPAYNRAGLIGQTLQSLLNQTLMADEIIVVDDGSTDSTAEAAESEFSVFSRQFSGKGKLPEFKVIRQVNAGPGAARNRGFAESRGEFIHFFDSDDLAALNKHEVQVRALQVSGADIAYGPWVKGHIVASEKLKAENGEKLMPATCHSSPVTWHFVPEGHVLQQKGLPKGDLIKELLTRWSIVPQACMFRRSIIEKSGGFPDDMFVAEDQLMFLRCLLAGARVVSTPQALTFYRLGSAGKLTESHEARDRRVSDWLLFLERADEECRLHRINPQRWFHYNRRLWSAAREATKASKFTIDDGRWNAVMWECLFMASSSLRRWRSGLKRRLIGRRSESCFRAGPLSADQAKLFPTCFKSRD
jgi:glycosyltransferase involved in cell wall biosynthesis